MTDDTRSDDLDWLYDGAKPAPAVTRPVTPRAPKAPTPPRPRVTPDDFHWLYGNGRTSGASPQPAGSPSEPAPRIVPPPTPPTAPATPKPHTPPTPPPAAPPSAPPGRPRLPLRRKIKRAAVTIVVLAVLWVGFLVYAPVHAWDSVPQADDTPAGTRPPQQPGTAILLVGSDSRDDLTPQQQAEWGTGGDVGSRTDVMMLYYIPPHGDPALISLPRDSYLPIPGHGKNKLNAAYAFGGPSLLVQTVEQDTGLRIDGYLEIGFAGFVTLVDDVGGINVCLDAPMSDVDANIDLPAGCQTLNGAQALGYVRQRHEDPLGDLGRVQRQRQVISQVIQKLAKPSTVLNPVRYWNTCQSLTGVLTKGKDTGFGVVKTGALGGLSVAKGNAISLTVPISNPNATTPAGSSVLWDDAKATAMFGMLAKGDTSQLDQFR